LSSDIAAALVRGKANAFLSPQRLPLIIGISGAGVGLNSLGRDRRGLIITLAERLHGLGEVLLHQVHATLLIVRHPKEINRLGKFIGIGASSADGLCRG
jgi:hypothetical protein